MLEAMGLVDQWKLHSVVGKLFPLESAADAHRAMEDRNVFGKLVLQVP